MSKFNIDERLSKIPQPHREEIKGSAEERTNENQNKWVLFDSNKYSYQMLVGRMVRHTYQGDEKAPSRCIAYKDKPEPELTFEYKIKPWIPKKWSRKISEISNIKWILPIEKTGGVDEQLQRGRELMEMDSGRLEFQYEMTTLKDEVAKLQADMRELKNEFNSQKNVVISLIKYIKANQPNARPAVNPR